MGLTEAQALDDYANNAVRAACRANDEKNDWTAITAEILNRHSSSPSFFHAEGMRFHLPAYLIADLDNAYKHEFAYHLCGPSEKFSLLTRLQRSSVELYLRAICERGNMVSYQHDVKRALEEWAAF
ncbi:DUF6714 family protein [Rhizobium hainanense]|uniref:DUF6714 family protein n=1 Tax=Rhizobium hainanense TaxID=52131 RepID=UPI00313D281E